MGKLILKIDHVIEKIVEKIFFVIGHSISFLLGLVLSAVWISSQPLHSLYDVAFAAITVAPFLLLFTIQKWQSKFALSLQLKLNELIATQENASNRLINIESLSEDELRKLAALYNNMQSLHEKEKLHPSHSVELEIEKDQDAGKQKEE